MNLLVYYGAIINMFPKIEKKENRSRNATERDVPRLFLYKSILYNLTI
jgi:hypothetical protein